MTTNYTLQDVQNVFAKTGSTLNSKYASQDPNILYLQAQSSIMNAGNYERVKDSRGEGILDTTTGQFVAGINIGDGAGVTDDAAAQRISAQKRAEQGITLGQTIATDPTATNPTGLTTPAQTSNPQTEQTEAQRQAAIAAGGQQPAPQGTTPTPATPAAPVSTYTGPSVVDYLASIGQPSDFASRALLAQKLGIQNYSGTASQNTQMLDTLRKGSGGGASTPPASGAGTGTGSGTGGSSGTGTGTGAGGTAEPETGTKSFLDIYNDALKASGLTDIKAEFDKVQKEYDDMANELNDKIIDVNSNPWLSEGVRLAEVKKLQDRYDGKMGILTNKLKIYDSLYQRAQSEARFVATGIQEDQQKMMELAQNEAEARAKLLEINPANFKEVRGGLYDIKNDSWVVPPKADDSPTGGVLSTLPLSIQNRVLSLSTGFGSNEIVKRFNAVVEGLNQINGISSSSQNPADHQAIVYAFAKSLDPDSAVKEGEYETIRKYAQSLVNRYGKEITNAINGTGFLSEKAIADIKTTMNNNFNNRRPSYDNLYNQTGRVIDNIAGLPVSDEVLIDYASGLTDTSFSGGSDDPDNISIGSTFNGADGFIYLRTGEDSFEAVGSVAK